jgi:hypothetical protein
MEAADIPAPHDGSLAALAGPLGLGRAAGSWPRFVRLALTFLVTPTPRRDIPYNGLGVVAHCDVLYCHLLFSAGAVSFKRLQLGEEGPGKLIQGPLCVLLPLEGLQIGCS